MIPPAKEHGAALLTILLLVAVIAVLAAHGIDRLAGATKLASNSRELSQAKAYLVAAETIALKSAEDIVAISPEKTTNIGNWNGSEQTYPVPGGVINATLSDGGNCFNINSLVKQTGAEYSARPAGIQQFIRLMRVLEVPERDAFNVAASVTDWIDTDDDPAQNGAEDIHYQQLEKPYLSANALIIDVSEIRAIKGVTTDIYRRIIPWLCALPATNLSPININTLRPEQVPLLIMLSDNIDIVRARQFLGRRAVSGYASLNDFWAEPFPASMAAGPEVQTQVKLSTRWFRIDMSVVMQSALVEQRALIDAGRRPARLVHRQRADIF